MKATLALLATAVVSTAGVIVAPSSANAVVYCQYINYPVNCVARPGVRLVARPVARAVSPGVGAPGVGVLPGTPTNRGGPVDRAGRR